MTTATVQCSSTPSNTMFKGLLRSRVSAGGEARPEGHDRIEHLARMRNAALGPMLRTPGGGPPAWRADRLVFVNDVFFCARDVLRLLRHAGADLACGMDFLAYKGPPSTLDVHPYGIDAPPLSVRALTGSCTRPSWMQLCPAFPVCPSDCRGWHAPDQPGKLSGTSARRRDCTCMRGWFPCKVDSLGSKQYQPRWYLLGTLKLVQGALRMGRMQVRTLCIFFMLGAR